MMAKYGVENVPDAPFQIINGVGQIPDADEVMGNDESIREWLRNVAMEALLPTGTILQYGADTTPEGFLPCNGTPYDTTEYAALFAVIGYSFTEASTGNFNTPDIRGRVLFGDSGVLELGQSDNRSVSERDGTHAHYMDHTHLYGQDPYNQRFTQGGGADPLGTTYGSTQGASATNTGIASPDFLVVNSIIKS
jgi:hypothetical protein